MYVFFFKQKTAYEMRISDWSSDVCSSDLIMRQPSPPLSVRVLVRRISGTAVLARHPMCRTIQNQGDAKMIRKLTLCSAAAFFEMSGVAMAHDGSHPNDAQIAHIAYTAGQIDIAAGKQALAKSKNKAVRAFAEERWSGTTPR